MTRGLTAVVCCALLAFAGCAGGDEASSAGDPTKPSSDASNAEGSSSDADGVATQPLARTTVEVYYPSIEGNGLVGKYSEIFQTATPGDQVKQIIADLISDPDNPQALSALPSGTRLRQAFVLENGDCYLDFTRDLIDGIGGGSMEELLTVYAIIDSVVLNISQIRRVGILVEGEPIETLNGHMDLRRPLRPNFSLILAPVIVEERRPGADPVIASATSRVD